MEVRLFNGVCVCITNHSTSSSTLNSPASAVNHRPAIMAVPPRNQKRKKKRG